MIIRIRQTAIGLGVALATVAVGCKNDTKKSSQSEVRTLDNLTRAPSADLTVNKCGPDAVTPEVEKIRNYVSGNNADLVLKTLGAAPKTLLTAFFGQGGRVEVTEQAAAICGMESLPDARLFAEGTADYSSCWVKKSGEPPVIYLANDPGKIRHSLLRSLAYVYVGPVAEALKTSYPQNTANLATNLKRLADSLLAALKDKDQAASARMNTLAARSRVDFERIVFAETVDSIYCSSASYATISAVGGLFRPVFDEFAAKDRWADGLANDLGQPWHL